METAVEEPQATQAPQDPAAEPPVQPEGRACAQCGAALSDGQDWCLECGTAAQRRRSSLPGWRTGAATIIATVVLASGAVAAAYAAITSDGDTPPSQNVGVIPDPNATAQVPQPDAIDIPSEQEVPPIGGTAAPPDASAQVPPPVAPPPAATPAPTPTPVTPTPITPTPTPVSPPTGTGTPPTGNPNANGNNNGNTAKPVTRAPLKEIPLQPGTTVAAAFNPPAPAGTTPGTTTTPAPDPTQTAPAGPTQTTPAPPPNGKVHADTDFTGDPSAAFDGNPTTAWSVALTTPDLVTTPQAGLLIDLGNATKLRRLVITPTTPGTTIEVYGSNAAAAPATLDDKGWKKLATQLDVDGETKITLGKDTVGTDKVRQLLIWFADGPDDGTSTSVGISELQLYR